MQPNDTIDGTAAVHAAEPGRPKEPFVIHDAVSRGVDTVATMTALSINCAYAKLSLDRRARTGSSTRPSGSA